MRSGRTYVIAIETGEVVKKFSTGVGRNDDPLHITDVGNRRSNALGQATIVADSLHTDGDPLADFAYAADLFGHVYRFDLRGSSTKEISTIFSAVGSTTGTTAGSPQPITSPVAVARHPLGLGMLVLFGTGKYLEIGDGGDRQVQSFYAIWDTGSDDPVEVPRTALLRQAFAETNIVMTAGEEESAAEVTRGRTSTAELIDWSKQLGWYIDFDIEKETGTNLNKGERVVNEPMVQGGRVDFVSLVPENNPCANGGYSWINSLDVRNGSRLGLTPFDYNLDGANGEADLLATKDGTRVVGTSVRLTPGGQNTGIYSSPSSFGDGAGRITTVVSTSEGDLALINAADVLGWRVWQQLR
ncbi:PilC/PilY family type IV pilus protein [uncultured Lamprocystis sp.]|uniref:PilC/PilY family type IV pilus protein n=1 Tax=uncultured Lamprocystis sp. TaxID=543132 RepID=UPI0026011F26|nr:PilC/PilY family type IV pilus protein [uncultured Lamprocystis sp.]